MIEGESFWSSPELAQLINTTVALAMTVHRCAPSNGELNAGTAPLKNHSLATERKVKHELADSKNSNFTAILPSLWRGQMHRRMVGGGR